MESRSMINTTS